MCSRRRRQWIIRQFHRLHLAGAGAERLLVAVNYSAHQSQCYVRLPFSDLGDKQWTLKDLLDDAHYERAGNDLQSKGLYLDVAPWQSHVFEMSGA
jgi:hypothetical protein